MSAAGAGAISVIRAPATVVMAVAPIAIQYVGASSAGSGRRSIRPLATTSATPPYRTTPIDQQTTASNAGTGRATALVASTDAASTATD